MTPTTDDEIEADIQRLIAQRRARAAAATKATPKKATTNAQT